MSLASIALSAGRLARSFERPTAIRLRNKAGEELDAQAFVRLASTRDAMLAGVTTRSKLRVLRLFPEGLAFAPTDGMTVSFDETTWAVLSTAPTTIAGTITSYELVVTQ